MICLLVCLLILSSCNNQNKSTSSVSTPQVSEPVIQEKQYDQYIQDYLLPQEITENDLKVAKEYYNKILSYINGDISFEEAYQQSERIIESSNSEHVVEVEGISGIRIFFELGIDNPQDELLLAAMDVLALSLNPSEYEPISPESTSNPTFTEGKNDVSYGAELVLMQIAEDVAKQVAQNPGTVDFKNLYWGFAREGRIYAVQGTFECSNLLGVTEEHDIQVWCEASEDYSKIQPYAVYLDGNRIA